jgi:hypothetical protein
MLHPLLQAAYRKVTGTPYYTTRQASIEFGPPPAAVHVEVLKTYTDAELMRAWGPEFVADLRGRRRVGAGR